MRLITVKCENCGVLRSLVNAKYPMINTESKFEYDLTNIQCHLIAIVVMGEYYIGMIMIHIINFEVELPENLLEKLTA